MPRDPVQQQLYLQRKRENATKRRREQRAVLGEKE
jgi:hypothetical protein